MSPPGGSDGRAGEGLSVRQATASDRNAVAAFTKDTWADRGGSDYIPGMYHDWIAGDGDDQRTFLIEADEPVTQETPEGEAIEHRVAGVCQGVVLSVHEAWAQGMRVNPAYRGRGASIALTDALLDWAAERGATVCRNMVFSWNAAGLGQSRAAGFEPATSFRWAHPTPDADATGPLPVRADPHAAWSYWSNSDARAHLRGLALDAAESWAVSELTHDGLIRAADERELFAVVEGHTRGMGLRNRHYERETDDGETETWAEYAVGAWEDVDAARSLFAAVARDAADLGADRTRVLVPETPRAVSDTSFVRAGIADAPDFVLAADLSGR